MTEAEIRMLWLQAKDSKHCQQPPEARREAGKRFCLGAFARKPSSWHLDFRPLAFLKLSSCAEQKASCVMSTQVCRIKAELIRSQLPWNEKGCYCDSLLLSYLQWYLSHVPNRSYPDTETWYTRPQPSQRDLSSPGEGLVFLISRCESVKPRASVVVGSGYLLHEAPVRSRV